MRNRWCLLLLSLAGCLPFQTNPEEPATQQVATTFGDPRKALPARVHYPPAAPDVGIRLLLVKDKLVGHNPQFAELFVTAIGSADPEIFHVGTNQIFVTEGLVRQCETDGKLAGALANEMGRMVAEREALIADEIRQPERLRPIAPQIGNSVSREVDPTQYAELARFEKEYPKHARKLTPPNPQQVARGLLENAGFQRTELDAAWPVLQNAARFNGWEGQFKGTSKQSGWKAP